MELTSLFESINKDIRAEIKRVNCGGCGYFALYLSRALKSIGLHPFIVVEDSAATKKKRYVNEVMNGNYKNASDASARHFTVHVKGFCVDGTGHDVDTRTSFVWYTDEEMEVALQHGIWNDQHDTDQNEKVEEIINTHISKLKNDEKNQCILNEESLY